MDIKMKKEFQKKIDEFTNGFWNIDCLIRIMKDITTNNCLEAREEDIYIICDLLVKESALLTDKIKELKLNLENEG